MLFSLSAGWWPGSPAEKLSGVALAAGKAPQNPRRAPCGSRCGCGSGFSTVCKGVGYGSLVRTPRGLGSDEGRLNRFPGGHGNEIQVWTGKWRGSTSLLGWEMRY